MKPYELLTAALRRIEIPPYDTIGIPTMAREHGLSAVHLQRLFRFAFGQPLAGYMRARRLALSLEELLQTDRRVLDIALAYGFAYEQSYIRAFRRAYGVSPGECRQKGITLRVTPPLALFDRNRIGENLLLGPELVMVPGFHVIGRRSRLSFEESLHMAPEAGIHFWEQDRPSIVNATDPQVYIGLTRIEDAAARWSYYLPSVQVPDLLHIPEDLTGDTFPACLCARFRYIGNHHFYDINHDIAGQMYDRILEASQNLRDGYQMAIQRLFFERIDTAAYDGEYCQMEWISPVTKGQAR